MRTEAEMMELILGFARKDKRVRAVWMNGSRANPNAKRDQWQDFDIVFAVTEMGSFLADDSWLDIFGERVIMQSSREQLDQYDADGNLNFEDWFIAMMQFADGNRIDLSLVPLESAAEKILSDKMCRLLLDKDGILPNVPPSTDEDYRVKLPTELEFRCCVNEVRWVAPYVAKGIWRKEIPYAQEMLGVVREQVVRMLGWEITLEQGKPVNIGKCGKYLEDFLPADQYRQFLEGYAGGTLEQIRKSLFVLYDLFALVSGKVAEKLGFRLDRHEEEKVRQFLQSEEKSDCKFS
ncbi:MAG: aminoglycoside 6-adenylyltransferase [Candidatus Merdivicinus sp.]